MGPVLNGLIKLQSVEHRLGAAKAKLARCRRNVVIQENQVRHLQSTLEAKKEELKISRVQSDRLELELKTKDEAVAKSRATLNVAKTNKEYAAILMQMNITKADNSKLESQILELMKDIEADGEEIKKIEQQIEEQKQNMEKVRKDSEVMATKYEAEINEIQIEWDQAAKGIPGEALDIFKRVAETYDGEALAVIDTSDDYSTAYSCGGCFMGITAENVNLLMSKDDILRCPNCTRILVIGKTED